MKFRLFATAALSTASVCMAAPVVAQAPAPDVVVTAPDRQQLSSWLEATTDHFVIVADMSEAELRRRALRLERMHALLSTIAPSRSENRLLIYLTDGITTIQQMARMDNIAGYYVPTAMGAFAVSPEDFTYKMQGWTPEVVLFHEYTHHMLLQTNGQYFPGWATEGLAEFFATARLLDNGGIEVGAPNQARARSMFAMNRWDAERLFRSDLIKLQKEETIEKYTRGALLVHYLLMNRERAPQFTRYIDLVNRGTDPVAAGQQAFGNLKALDSALDAYRRRSGIPTIVYTAEQLKAPTAVTIRTLAKDEAEALPVSLESMTDEDREHVAEQVVGARRMAAKFPGSAMALQVLGQSEYEAGNFADAERAIDRALAYQPDNLMARLYKGRILGQKALVSKLPADWNAARSWFVRANRQNPNHPWPFVLLFDSYLAEGRTVPAGIVTGLRRAVVLAPQDEGVRVRMALQQIREGDLAGARLMIAPVAFSPHGKPDAAPAKFYPILKEETDKDVLLAKAEELKVPVNSFFPKKKEPATGGTGKAGAVVRR